MKNDDLRREYSRLRHVQANRIRRAESAGFSTGYKAPVMKGLTDSQLKKELGKLRAWLAAPENTLAGRRIERQVEEERKEARRERKNALERERYRRQREQEGKTYTPRVQRTEEERRERERERKRAYRERKKLALDIDKALAGEPEETRKALKNLLKGLRKHGVTVSDIGELKKWGEYIKERRQDSEKEFYEFDVWLDELARYSDKTVEDLSEEDITRLLDDFESWKSDKEKLKAEMLRPRQSNEYTPRDLGSMITTFINVRKGRPV